MAITRCGSVAIAALAVFFANAALAQEVDCPNAQVQSELNACAEQEWQQADEALNDAYAKVLAKMAAIDSELADDEQGAVANLKEGQRAWIAFRDATCAAEGYPMHGGSAEPMLIYGCRARLTEQRTDDLEMLALPY